MESTQGVEHNGTIEYQREGMTHVSGLVHIESFLGFNHAIPEEICLLLSSGFSDEEKSHVAQELADVGLTNTCNLHVRSYTIQCCVLV